MKLVKCDSVKERYDEGIQLSLIKATWRDDKGEETIEKYHAVRGGVVYPAGVHQGYMVVAGQVQATEVIRVLREFTFQVLSEVIEALPGLSKTLCLGRIYYDGSEEGRAFVARIRKAVGGRENAKGFKTPILCPSPKAEFPTFGNDVIRQFLKDRPLLLPAESELARQMSAGRVEAHDEDRLYAVKALRFLVCGFYFYPFQPPHKRQPPRNIPYSHGWMGR